MNMADLPPEDALLVEACRLVLPPSGEERLATLLRSPLDWPLLRREAALFRAEPLLYHQLSRPSLRDLVPADALEAFKKAYERTSMKNLQIYGVLRRVLNALEAAGVQVILLKGSFLAKWVYEDIGLRPMGDIDLLCRKQDEAALWRILEEQGATGRDEPMESEKLKVVEHVGHGPPRYFGNIARLEVHFHLLSRKCSDPARLEAILWSEALVHDWDGLPVRSLGWEHQVIHLASHLHLHAKVSGIFLYWFSDLIEVLRNHGGTLNWQWLGDLARELHLDRDCREVFELLCENWNGGGPQIPGQSLTPRQVLALTRDFRQSGVPYLLTYWKILLAGRFAGGPWARLLYGVRLVFPPWKRMVFRHPGSSRLFLASCYLLDPLVRVGRILKALSHYVQPRFRH